MQRILPLVLLAACTHRAPWEGVQITSAQLQSFDLSSIAIIGGGLGGDAMLVFQTPGGGGGELPVLLSGGTVGLAVRFAGDVEGHSGAVEIELEDVEDPTVADVLGTYRGTAAAGGAIIGASSRRMRNGRGAAFSEEHFEVGISVFAGFEWVGISPGGGEGTPAATGDTGALVVPEPPEIERVDPRGCGSGPVDPVDPIPRDTGATPTTPTTTTPTTTTTGPTGTTTGTTGTTTGTGGSEASSSGSSGCDCDGGDSSSSSSSCDDSSCDHGGGRLGMPLLALLLALRRREVR